MKWIKKIIKAFLFIIIFFVVINTGIYIYSLLTPKLEITTANNITFYDNSDNLFFQGSGSKSWVSLDEISSYLVDATINTEDKNFYSHFGFDYLRIAKALFTNIISGSNVQGASTITQQYAKNLFLDFDKTWQRKWDEMWITFELEAHYSKDEIIEGYLNTINYGHGMYGIQNASLFYFNKSASELSLAEATMLTGIPKSPSYYSPIVNEELAKSRQQMILKSMLDDELINQDEYNLAINEKLSYIGKLEYSDLSTVMYYQDAVLDELENITSISRSYLETGGLKVYTNLDIATQTQLENSINENISVENSLQVASVIMDPNTGKVLALTGGKDYNLSQYNRATQAQRQVGSTMKPFLYYAALENGFTSSTTFISEETTFTFADDKFYSPQNSNQTYGDKPISMATAIAYSENIYAVKTHMFLGEETLVDTAERMGIDADLEAVPSLPLGTSEISVLEMAQGYTTFANTGYKVEPYLIRRVENSDGEVLYEADIEKERVLNESLTFILNNMLTSTYDPSFIDYNYPTSINLNAKINNTYALKTGTTDTDHWHIGFNPNIVSVVWVGYDDNSDLEASQYKVAQNIWLDTMNYHMIDKEDIWYEQPNNISQVIVEPISGKPASEEDEKKKIMYFIKGTEPSLTDMTFDEISFE